MTTTILTDALVPVRQALGDRLGRPHRGTLARWASRGLRTKGGSVVKLDAVQIGQRWMATRTAADRFCREVVAEPAAAAAAAG